MSRQNVEFLRLGYEALHRGDTEAFEAMSRERLDPDFTFHSHWAGRVFRGIAGTQEWMSDVRETWDDYDQEIEDIVDDWEIPPAMANQVIQSTLHDYTGGTEDRFVPKPARSYPRLSMSCRFRGARSGTRS